MIESRVPKLLRIRFVSLFFEFAAPSVFSIICYGDFHKINFGIVET